MNEDHSGYRLLLFANSGVRMVRSPPCLLLPSGMVISNGAIVTHEASTPPSIAFLSTGIPFSKAYVNIPLALSELSAADMEATAAIK